MARSPRERPASWVRSWWRPTRYGAGGGAAAWGGGSGEAGAGGPAEVSGKAMRDVPGCRCRWRRGAEVRGASPPHRRLRQAAGCVGTGLRVGFVPPSSSRLRGSRAAVLDPVLSPRRSQSESNLAEVSERFLPPWRDACSGKAAPKARRSGAAGLSRSESPSELLAASALRESWCFRGARVCERRDLGHVYLYMHVCVHMITKNRYRVNIALKLDQG